MDLRISVVLLLIFLTGGHSLKCYTCVSDLTGYCDAKVETCGYGLYKCLSNTHVEQFFGSPKTIMTIKQCVDKCESKTQQLSTGGTVNIHCCDTDLCNAAGIVLYMIMC
ncbi:Secreted Ly-6/uPAR-related protein 1 [Labeo rohita]|uniref:Secreted Ly-6/uPAR-related protein 1 n=1 Tax=Labeo rohita TaxID=84645 RepID=A0ABQ8L904_LABRO|nr:Secreted Ly-6/uPAR-related protein 1 [Labeo rohita]